MKNWLRLYGNRRVLSVLGLGFSSGLPLALTGATLHAWMFTEKVDLRIIGLSTLIGLPYTLKMIWSPIMDRFTPSFLGRRRGWIIITQLLLAGTIMLLSMSSPSSMPLNVALIAVFLAFFSASQDIVVDAYRTDVLLPTELGTGAATAVLGYRLAMLTSGAGALILSDHMSWGSVYGIMAALMLVNVIFTVFAPEPSEKVEPPSSLSEAVWGPLVAYFQRSGAVAMLLFIVLYKLGDVIAAIMTTPFLLDLGFSRTEVGAVYKAFGLISTILGALLGGGIITRIGINRSLWIFAFLQAFSNLSFTVLAVVGKSHSCMVGAVALENCDKRFTATQYALLTSLMGTTRVLFGAPSGFMAQALGWPAFYTVSVVGAIPAILLLPRFAPWRS